MVRSDVEMYVTKGVRESEMGHVLTATCGGIT